MSNTIGGLQQLTGAQLQSMDLESALMAVQGERSRALENQLRGQLDAVQAKNEQIAKMNGDMNARRADLVKAESELSKAGAELAQNEKDVAAADATASSRIPANEKKIAELTLMRDQLAQVRARDPNYYTGLSYGWGGDDVAKSVEMKNRLAAEGLDISGIRDIDGNGTLDAHGSTLQGWMDQLNSKIDGLRQDNTSLANGKADLLNKQAELKQSQADLQSRVGSLKVGIDDMKAGIDSLTNSQQMDMLRLQSLSNKRNEAFEIMTNFIKKMNDNRGSIVGNMR